MAFTADLAIGFPDMKIRLRVPARIRVVSWLALGFGVMGESQVQKEASVAHASGTFDVKRTPQAKDAGAEGSNLGRMSIDKQFHGDLEGTSKGEMLAASTSVQSSAG